MQGACHAAVERARERRHPARGTPQHQRGRRDANGAAAHHNRERFSVRPLGGRSPAHRRGRRQRPSGAGHAGGDSLVQDGCAPKRSRPVERSAPFFCRTGTMRRQPSSSNFRRRKGFSIIPNSRRAGICGDGWRIRRPMFCCRFEAGTCFLAAARPPVLSRQRWRADRRLAPCRPSSDRRAKQTARHSSSTL